jgi:hypothetical protein
VGVIPNTTGSGSVYASGGSGQNDGHWAPLPDSKDYAVSGTLAVASGADNYLPPFPYPSNATLLYVVAFVRAGSITLDIEQNGTGIGGLTGLAVTDSPTTFTPTDPASILANDLLACVIDSVDGADGLMCSFVFTVTL